MKKVCSSSKKGKASAWLAGSLCCALALATVPASFAQDQTGVAPGGGGTPAAPVAPAAPTERALPPISLDLRDAPVRQALEQLFNSAKVDYSIDNAVQGFITLRITDQPFENALRLILRSSSVPLTYTKESGVYIVKLRTIETAESAAATPPPAPTTEAPPTTTNYDVIQLTYADPADLAQILGITFVRTFTREGGQRGNGGFGGGGFGGGGTMGGFGGGGFGGGGVMGGMGGGLGSMMGGLGGGMMGGGIGGGGFGGGYLGGGRGF